MGWLAIYNKEIIEAKLYRWDKYIKAFSLPAWDELPDFDLYMDQVISLIGRFLDLLPHGEANEPVITPSTINNYVRMKIMPAPVKKKYTRIHLAYLIIICLLKQSLSISVVSRIIPMNISEDEAKEIFDKSSSDDLPVKNLILDSAICSNLNKLLTEKLVALEIRPKPEADEGEE